MDVFGRNPTTKEGEYFQNTVWWWRPLADYVCQIAPEITNAYRSWQSKDGDGLVAQASIALANKPQGEIDSGRALAYEMPRNSKARGVRQLNTGSAGRLDCPREGKLKFVLGRHACIVHCTRRRPEAPTTFFLGVWTPSASEAYCPARLGPGGAFLFGYTNRYT
jgi:hypothetical protein